MSLSDRPTSGEVISDWEAISQQGHAVPAHRSLPDLTAELTSMLADPDPHVRDELAFTTLRTWIEQGVYDDLLAGLGDGMAAGLTIGVGESEGDDVFRRSFSALALASCIDRDTAAPSLPDTQIMIWGDCLVTWLLAEHDLRGYVADKGWALAVSHGADALGALGASPHLGPAEQQMMLDVLAERLSAPISNLLTADEPDRCAAAVLRILRRNDLSGTDLEPWVETLIAAAESGVDGGDPTSPEHIATTNVQSFLRALYLHLSLSTPAPEARADLLLLLVDALRRTNASHLELTWTGNQ